MTAREFVLSGDDAEQPPDEPGAAHAATPLSEDDVTVTDPTANGNGSGTHRPLLEQALELAGWDLRVFPLGADCTPTISAWPDLATTTAETVEGWAWPNIGVATGQGVYVIDVDLGHEEGVSGLDTLNELEILNGELPKTYTVTTPGGGEHQYYRSAASLRSRTGIFPGVDFKGERGYVVAEGSSRAGALRSNGTVKAGGVYTSTDSPSEIAGLPAWFEAFVSSDEGERVQGPLTPSTDSLDQAIAEKYSWAEILTEAGGQLAYRRRRYDAWTRPGKSPREGHSAVVWADNDRLQVWTSNWYPFAPGATYSRLQALAMLRWGGDFGRSTKELARELGVERPSPTPEVPSSPSSSEAVNESGRNTYGHWFLQPVSHLRTLQRPKPLIRDGTHQGGLLIEGTIAVLYGPSGSYKSFVALSMACSIATGSTWCGFEAVQRNAAYLAGEGIYGYLGRTEAWETDRALTLQDSRLAFTTSGMPLVDDPLMAAKLREDLDARDVGFLVVDTLARSMKGDENSTQDMSAYIRGLESLREGTSRTILVVHHSGKDSSRGARGSSVLLGAVDTELSLTKLEQGPSAEPDSDSLDYSPALTGSSSLSPVVRLSQTKQKDVEQGPPIYIQLKTIELREEGSSLVATPGRPPATETPLLLDERNLSILEAVRKGLTIEREIAEATSIPKSDVHRRKTALLKHGFLVKGPEGELVLPAPEDLGQRPNL